MLRINLDFEVVITEKIMSVSPQEAARRLAEAGFQRGDRYIAGASGKGSKQVAGAMAGVNNYKEGLNKSLAEGRYEKGIQSAGPTAYDEGVRNKGANNWGPGMQVGAAKYQKNIQKVANLWNQPLTTARGAKGSAANLTRMQENVKRFQAAK